MLFGYLPALAQEKRPTNLAGVSVIGVLLPASGAVAFERVGQLLEKRGYRIKTRDQTALRLHTEPRSLYEVGCSASVQVIIMGHTALFPGFGNNTNSPYPLVIRSLSYSAYSHVRFGNLDYVAMGWEELEAIVQALSGKVKVVDLRHP